MIVVTITPGELAAALMGAPPGSPSDLVYIHMVADKLKAAGMPIRATMDGRLMVDEPGMLEHWYPGITGSQHWRWTPSELELEPAG